MAMCTIIPKHSKQELVQTMPKYLITASIEGDFDRSINEQFFVDSDHPDLTENRSELIALNAVLLHYLSGHEFDACDYDLTQVQNVLNSHVLGIEDSFGDIAVLSETTPLSEAENGLLQEVIDKTLIVPVNVYAVFGALHDLLAKLIYNADDQPVHLESDNELIQSILSVMQDMFFKHDIWFWNEEAYAKFLKLISEQ